MLYKHIFICVSVLLSHEVWDDISIIINELIIDYFSVLCMGDQVRRLSNITPRILAVILLAILTPFNLIFNSFTFPIIVYIEQVQFLGEKLKSVV